jgi:hypothetical protein
MGAEPASRGGSRGSLAVSCRLLERIAEPRSSGGLGSRRASWTPIRKSSVKGGAHTVLAAVIRRSEADGVLHEAECVSARFADAYRVTGVRCSEEERYLRWKVVPKP